MIILLSTPVLWYKASLCFLTGFLQKHFVKINSTVLSKEDVRTELSTGNFFLKSSHFLQDFLASAIMKAIHDRQASGAKRNDLIDICLDILKKDAAENNYDPLARRPSC